MAEWKVSPLLRCGLGSLQACLITLYILQQHHALEQMLGLLLTSPVLPLTVPKYQSKYGSATSQPPLLHFIFHVMVVVTFEPANHSIIPTARPRAIYSKRGLPSKNSQPDPETDSITKHPLRQGVRLWLELAQSHSPVTALPLMR